MKNFNEYATSRFLEDSQLDINSLRTAILEALGGNPNNEDAFNSPLIQFAQPEDIMDRLNTIKGLEQIISTNPATVKAIQSAGATNLTVGELAALIVGGQENSDLGVN